ncbi:MAG: ATP-binding protein [Ignavibacteriaceae bacterium]
MRKNPFKFGTVVSKPHFTNRKEEITRVVSLLESHNHLILMSPRRYGKTSLINFVIKSIKRPAIIIDLQMVTSYDDLASLIIKRINDIFPLEKLKNLLKSFRIVPTIMLNPVSSEIEVSFKGSNNNSATLEDSLNLVEKISKSSNRIIVVFDEFQEIKKIGKNAENHLRAILQLHKNVNYVFMGSFDSLMREMFNKKKSPFYHFGYVLNLHRIPYDEFLQFLSERFKPVTKRFYSISEEILSITNCHPYHTQQLSFSVYENLSKFPNAELTVKNSLMELVGIHDNNYEIIWNGLNRTDMKVLIGLALSSHSPMSEEFSKEFDIGATSTIYSSIKKLSRLGFIVKQMNMYQIDDPLFKEWIRIRRM